MKSRKSVLHFDWYSIFQNSASWSQISTREARKFNLFVWWGKKKKDSVKNTALSQPVSKGVLFFLRMFCILPESLYFQQNRLLESLNIQTYSLLLPFLANEKCFVSILEVGKMKIQRATWDHWLVWSTSSPKKRKDPKISQEQSLSFSETLLY